ncbi:MAG: hypothetical protein U0792_16920 [Gemmataceae bacterium]
MVFAPPRRSCYNAADETITGALRYNQGDDFPFVWRVKPAATKAAARPSARGKKK